MDIQATSKEDLINNALTDDEELYTALCNRFGEKNLLNMNVDETEVRSFVSEFVVSNPDF